MKAAKLLVLATLWTPLVALSTRSTGLPQSPSKTNRPTQFLLLKRSSGFGLRFTSNRVVNEVTIPREWLVPSQEEADEETDSFVSSFNYNRQVQSFPIGDGRIGLHFSSYEIQSGGSAQAAAGRDVFLILDPLSLRMTQGGIRRGITQARVRDRGCFAAKSERYLIADVDGDGSADVGIVAEELQCIGKSDGWLTGPFYKQSPVVWYLLRNTGWVAEARFDGRMPEHYVELPLVGMLCSPVEPAGCKNGCPPGCDRSKWPHEIHAASAHGVTAHFGGIVPTGNLPLQSGVSALWFTFEGDPENYGFASTTKEPGDAHLDFSDWNLDIFSPAGGFVLLLQDTYGPYHIVATDKLKDYLSNGRKPDYAIAAPGANEPARIYRNGHWLSEGAVEFNVSCCGSSEAHIFTLPPTRE
jgi:hypothetical protein